MDWERSRVTSGIQNASDLVDAQRRRLDALVGRERPEMAKLRHLSPTLMRHGQLHLEVSRSLEPRTAQRAFGGIRLGKALLGTTHSTTGAHPTLDCVDRSGTARVYPSNLERRLRLRLLSAHDSPNGLPFSGAQPEAG
jgi:hypothetical protein